MSGKGTWVQGCGRCPSETHVKNLTIYEWHPLDKNAEVMACPQLDIHGTMDGLREGSFSGPEYPKVRASVNDELKWCGCGDGDRVDELMLDYLTWKETYWTWVRSQDERVRIDWTQTPDCPLAEDVQILLAYIADAAGWTEHGGSVFGAWLTDDGDEALANLRKPEYDRA